MWNDSTPLASAGGIYNLPDYYWYKEDGLMKFEGITTNNHTAITSYNLTKDELSKLSDIGNFSFQLKKQHTFQWNERGQDFQKTRLWKVHKKIETRLDGHLSLDQGKLHIHARAPIPSR